MNTKNRTAKLLSLLFACVVGAGSIGAGLVASARTSNDNDNKTPNGRVARRAENSNNNAGETNDRTKPKPRGSTSGTTTSGGGGNKPSNANKAKDCKEKGCNQKGGRG